MMLLIILNCYFALNFYIFFPSITTNNIRPNKIKFHIGTGFSDAQRKKPPKKGDVVTFKFQEVVCSYI
jgi:hypothetical protein